MTGAETQILLLMAMTSGDAADRAVSAIAAEETVALEPEGTAGLARARRGRDLAARTCLDSYWPSGVVGARHLRRQHLLEPPASARGRLFNGIAIAALVGLGAFGAGRLALAAIEVKTAETEFSVDVIHRAQALVPRDPSLSDTESQILLKFVEIGPTEDLAQQQLASTRHTVERDRRQSLWWNRLAIAEFGHGPGPDEARVAAVAAAVQSAYDRNPWSLMTLQKLHALAIETGDTAGIERWSAALCQIDACPESNVAAIP